MRKKDKTANVARTIADSLLRKDTFLDRKFPYLVDRADAPRESTLAALTHDRKFDGMLPENRSTNVP